MSRVTFLRHVIWAVPNGTLHRCTGLHTLHRRAASVYAATDHGLPSLKLIAASPLATQLVAHYFATSLQSGDAYLLFGEVGAGKSYFRYTILGPIKIKFSILETFNKFFFFFFSILPSLFLSLIIHCFSFFFQSGFHSRRFM